MFFDILKAFLIGICASVPLGPTAIYILQKTLSKGQRGGYLTAMGATVTDTFYSVIAVFFLALAQTFIDEHQTLIYFVGGLIVLLVGSGMLFVDPFRKVKEERTESYSVNDFFRAVALGLSNPASIVVIFTLFTFFDIDLGQRDFHVIPILLAVALGSATYWFFFTLLFSKLRKKFNVGVLLWINRLLGEVVMNLGVVLLGEVLLRVLFP